MVRVGALVMAGVVLTLQRTGKMQQQHCKIATMLKPKTILVMFLYGACITLFLSALPLSPERIRFLF